MFILINFGYRSRKIFTIDCLAAALFDHIWQACYRELIDTYHAKDVLFVKEAEAHQAKIEANEKKLEAVTAKLKEEEDAAGGDKKVTHVSSRKMTRRQPKKGEKMLLLRPLSNRKS